MPVSLSTFSETSQPVETPVVEAPAVVTPDIDTTIVETPATTEAPAVETPKEENASDFLIGDDIPAAAVAPSGTPPVFNLDEEIRKADPKELAKKLGFTDFAIEMNEYLAKGGKAEDYLNAKAIDYNKISDEDLVKEDYRKQYPNFTKEEINRLFNRKYGITEEMLDDEKEDKTLELKADAYSKRQSKIEQQQNFKIPETPILHTDEAYEQWKQGQQSQALLNENVVSYFNNHEATKALNESKRVTINLGDGVEPFNFNINKPEIITQSLTDGGKIISKLISTATGEPDVAKQQLLTTFAFNPQKFMQDIYNYGVQNGQRKLVSEGQNATRPTTPVHSITGEKATYKAGTYGG